MSDLRVSAKRRRLYRRKFDWDEARRRHAAGETYVALAREFGVHPSAVKQAVTTRDLTRPAGQDDILEILHPKRDRCPTCQDWKSKAAELCAVCRRDTRLAPPELVRIPGQARAILAGVRLGAIVTYRGEQAALEGHGPRTRILDYWDRPAEIVPDDIVVKVEPGWAVRVAGEIGGEEIA